MIKTSEYGGTFFIVHGNQSVTPINEQAYSAINEQNKQLQQYKSLVKTVDADNLPKCEVVAMGKGEILVGYLEACLAEATCEYEGMYLDNITHYIEQKDLIKIMSGV